jgi:transcriptional regulator with XRE-family HTH domain
MQKSQHTRKYRQLLEALRQARKDAGLTQGEVAKKLRTYASFVSKCESGERRIDVIELAAFCSLYKVTLADFLEALDIE